MVAELETSPLIRFFFLFIVLGSSSGTRRIIDLFCLTKGFPKVQQLVWSRIYHRCSIRLSTCMGRTWHYTLGWFMDASIRGRTRLRERESERVECNHCSALQKKKNSSCKRIVMNELPRTGSGKSGERANPIKVSFMVVGCSWLKEYFYNSMSENFNRRQSRSWKIVFHESGIL